MILSPSVSEAPYARDSSAFPPNDWIWAYMSRCIKEEELIPVVLYERHEM